MQERITKRWWLINEDFLVKNSSVESKKLTLPPPEGKLAVERVFFFLKRDRIILNGISFQLPVGDILAVIASSGSDKKTLARILVGYYKPVDGFVRLDGAGVNQ